VASRYTRVISSISSKHFHAVDSIGHAALNLDKKLKSFTTNMLCCQSATSITPWFCMDSALPRQHFMDVSLAFVISGVYIQQILGDSPLQKMYSMDCM
jgi:hypothetical protein